MSLDAVAHTAIDDGRPEDALPMLKDAVRIYVNVGQPAKVADSLSRIARAHAEAERPELGARLLASSLALRGDGRQRAAVRDQSEGEDACRHPELDEAAFRTAWEEGRALTADEAVALALAIHDSQ